MGGNKSLLRCERGYEKAGISGAYASPNGLRHGFAINAELNNMPLQKIRDWMGHKDLERTAVYLGIMGEEEYTLAERTLEDDDF